MLNQKYGKTPQIIHFNRIFHYKPSILGYPYFWKHPYQSLQFPNLPCKFSAVTAPLSSPTGGSSPRPPARAVGEVCVSKTPRVWSTWYTGDTIGVLWLME